MHQPAALLPGCAACKQLLHIPSAIGHISQVLDTVHAVVGRPIVDNCVKGFNASVLAYGMTGGGKTHTMLGALPRDSSHMPEDVRHLP